MRPSFWVSAYVRLSYVLFQASGRVNLAFGLVHESLGKWVPGFPSTLFFWPHFSMVFSWRSSEWAHALHVFGMLRKPATWWMCQDVGMWALRPGLNEYTSMQRIPRGCMNIYGKCICRRVPRPSILGAIWLDSVVWREWSGEQWTKTRPVGVG